jgi:UDP-2,3-diacylglucosamine pyrophosphatase LpxH
MKSLAPDNPKKTVLVISDLHLGAGKTIKGRRNLLEDFHYDGALIDFLRYYSSDQFFEREVELIINGDFLDFLAVPFVEYFDDEFWSEDAALEKIKMIILAHRDVFSALKNFISKPHKKIVYIFGNHDAEMIFDSVKVEFKKAIGDPPVQKFMMRNDLQLYIPVAGVYIQHGHQYEKAHDFNPETSLIESSDNKKYFKPPWGSYYVINLLNRYKQERFYINAVRPIKHFLIHGLLFDTFFTLRFMLSNIYYFIMVRFWYYFMQKIQWKKIFYDLKNELELFQDYESLTRDFFGQRPQAKVLIVGHTHNPLFRLYSDGTTFINTGTWTNMVNLELGNIHHSQALTYAQVDVFGENFDIQEFENNVNVDLKIWTGVNQYPYKEFR